jgi:DNA-binding NarL/FixJ family response regulator
MSEVSVLIADDRPFVRSGLKSVLRDEPGFVIVGEADTIYQAIELSRDVRPSVVVLGSMIRPVGVGGPWIARFRDLSPPPGVLVLSPAADDYVRRALDAGAAGLLLEQCSPEVMRAALRMVADGYTLLAPAPRPEGRCAPASRVDPGLLATLTEREFDVFELVARGRTNIEICKALSLSRNTVKSHMRGLLLKLGLRNRMETIIYAYQSGLPAYRLVDRPESRGAARNAGE